MASSTRRMSGMVAQAGPGGQALLDTMDAFRRKHVTQNKEIIHRNSDLMRNNADLTRQLREAQNELIASRAENMVLKAANIQLEVTVAKLHGRLERAEARMSGRSGGGLEEEKLRTLCSHLDSVVNQLQDMRSICSEAATAGPVRYPHPVSPPESPPYVHPTLSSSHPPILEGTSNITKRSRSDSAAPLPLVSAQPDLSLISEASQEPSITDSQRLGGMGYEDEEEYESGFDGDDGAGYEGNEAILQEYADYRQQGEGAGLAYSGSRQSSAEPEEVVQEIQDALIASPTRQSLQYTETRSRSKSPSLSPSPSPPPVLVSARPIAIAKQPAFGPVQLVSNLEDVLENAKDTIRQTRRRNSGVLPPPPKDLAVQTKERRKEKEKYIEKEVVLSSVKKKRSRPSLVEELGISPGRLNLDTSMLASGFDTDSGTADLKRKTRERSSTTGSVLLNSPKQQQEIGPESLGRTVRHSTSASGLREAALAEGGKISTPNAADPALIIHSVRRRKSVPGLSTNSASPLASSQAEVAAQRATFSPILSSGSTTIKTAAKNPASATTTSIVLEKRKPLVAGMQGRPSGGPVALVVTKEVASSSSSSAASIRPNNKPTPASTSQRKVPPSSLTGPPSSSRSSVPSNHLSAARERARSRSRSRSTTPEVEPPSVAASYTPVLQELSKASLSQPVSKTAPLLPEQKARSSPSSALAEKAKKDKGKQSAKEGEDRKRAPIRIEVVDDEEVHQLKAQNEQDEAPNYHIVTSSAQLECRSQGQRSARSLSASPGSSHSTMLSESQDSSTANQSNTLSAPASAAAGREGRRARSAVNYQEPSLTKKMRQPAGYVPSIKTVSSTKGVSGHHVANGSSSSLGVRRKSSLEVVGSRKPLSAGGGIVIDESDTGESSGGE